MSNSSGSESASVLVSMTLSGQTSLILAVMSNLHICGLMLTTNTRSRTILVIIITTKLVSYLVVATLLLFLAGSG